MHEFFININIRPPCKGCEERHTACHDHCEEFLSYKERCKIDKEAKFNYEEKKTRRRFGLRRL